MPTSIFEDLVGMSPSILDTIQQRLLEGEAARQKTLMENSNTAYQDYQGAVNAPIPAPGAATGVEQLFGDVASVLSRRPEFAQRTSQNIQQRRAEMLQKRIENIQTLHDRYLQQAELVGKIDPIKEIELRKAAEQQAKLIENIQENEKLATVGKQAMERTQAEQQGAMARTQEESRSRAEVAQIGSQAEIMRYLASENKGNLKKADRIKQLTDIRGQFIKPGQTEIPQKVRGIYMESILSVPPAEGQTEQQWLGEMQNAWRAAKNGKKLSPGEVARLVEARAQHTFGDTQTTVTPSPEPGQAQPLPPGVNPLTAPAQEVPGTPPDAALELIDEANQLVNDELTATGGMATARRQQAMVRLRRIQAELKIKYGLNMILPQKQGDIQVPGVEVK
jgi:hypothetical protein